MAYNGKQKEIGEEKKRRNLTLLQKNAHRACVCAKKVVPLSRILRFRQYGGLKSAKKTAEKHVSKLKIKN